MRLECGPVGSLARKYQCSCFVLLLARRRGYDRIDECVVHLQGVTEMLPHLGRHCAGHQRGGERLVPLSDLMVAKSRDKLARLIPSARARSKRNRPIGYVSSPKRA